VLCLIFGAEEKGMRFEARLAVGGFDSKQLPEAREAVAPDGTDVRILLKLEGGSMAHFELPPNHISRAVAHRTVSEIGISSVDRARCGAAGTVLRRPLFYVRISACRCRRGTQFQFRSFGHEPLSIVGVTMPPWPGPDEAYEVQGTWRATL